MATEVSARLDEQLTAVVEAGGDKIIIDLNQIESPSLPIIEQVLATIQACGKLSLKSAVICSDAVKAGCRTYADSQSWVFAKSFNEALAALGSAASATTAAVAG